MTWRPIFIQVLLLPLPWRVRRRLLEALCGYQIDRTAKIGLSIVAPECTFVMEEGSYIGHANIIRGMDVLTLGVRAAIGNLNWIYAIPAAFPWLSHQLERRPELILERRAAIANRHLIDCSDTIRLHRGAAVVGARTQLITHAIDMTESRQSTKPISIGRCSMVGSGCIVLGGSSLPDYSALGAGSTLRSVFSDTHLFTRDSG